MDTEADSTGRVAYSFPSGTFDLHESQASLCLASDDGSTTYVGLRPDWPRLFAAIRQLHVVLGAAAAGPLSLADTWEHPHFTRLPGTESLYDVDSGTEIQLTHLASAIAVVDDHGSQQTASLQFFDRQGKGCLKIMLTNFSDLDAFEWLLRRFAVPFDSGMSHPARDGQVRAAAVADPVTTDQVRAVWPLVGRTRPDTFIPGLPFVKRREAIEILGKGHAWRCLGTTIMRALELATCNGIPLTCAVHNPTVFLPVSLKPSHWHPCEAGLTFFSPYAQLTIRHGRDLWEGWATRKDFGIHAPLLLEVYDVTDQLCGTLGTARGADERQQRDWNAILKGAGS